MKSIVFYHQRSHRQGRDGPPPHGHRTQCRPLQRAVQDSWDRNGQKRVHDVWRVLLLVECLCLCVWTLRLVDWRLKESAALARFRFHKPHNSLSLFISVCVAFCLFLIPSPWTTEILIIRVELARGEVSLISTIEWLTWTFCLRLTICITP